MCVCIKNPITFFFFLDPGPPVFLAGERVGSAGILLSWNTPLHPNGRILSYIVKYKEVCPWMQTAYTQVTTKPDSLEVLLTSLNPGTTYEITVKALQMPFSILNSDLL